MAVLCSLLLYELGMHICEHFVPSPMTSLDAETDFKPVIITVVIIVVVDNL
jgi:hypothetical protein